MVAQSTLRTCAGKQVFFEKYFRFATAADVNECLNPIKLPFSHVRIVISYQVI